MAVNDVRKIRIYKLCTHDVFIDLKSGSAVGSLLPKNSGTIDFNV